MYVDKSSGFNSLSEVVDCVDWLAHLRKARGQSLTPIGERSSRNQGVIVGVWHNSGFSLLDPSSWSEVVAGLLVDESPLLV